MKKITHLRLANSVKVGPQEETYLTEQNFELALEGITIRMRHKKVPEKTVCTSLMNAVYWIEADEPAAAATPPQGSEKAAPAAPPPAAKGKGARGEVVL